MDILLKDISIKYMADDRNMLITATNTNIRYLYVRFSTPASHTETAVWYIDKDNLNNGLVLPKDYIIIYLAAVYDDDDKGIAIRQSGVYRLRFSNGEEFLKGMHFGDILPTKLADGVLLMLHERVEDLSAATVVKFLRSPIDISSALIPVKLPRTIEEVKGLQQRTIQIRDQVLARDCFQLNAEEIVNAEDDIPDFQVTNTEQTANNRNLFRELQERIELRRTITADLPAANRIIHTRPAYIIEDDITFTT